MKIALVIVGLAIGAIVGYFVRAAAVENAVWRELAKSVPSQALAPTEIQVTNDAVSSLRSSGSDQLGHVQLSTGDIWRFAFRSRHLLNDTDSFSVFAGPLGTFRVRGAYFCCEVQFPEGPATKDSKEFLAFLRRTNQYVEAMK